MFRRHPFPTGTARARIASGFVKQRSGVNGMAIKTVQAPIPGTFYRAANPGEPPFKADGDLVQAGDVVGLIEVMKTFNQVAAEEAGRLMRFLIENEGPVMAGQPLYELET